MNINSSQYQKVQHDAFPIALRGGKPKLRPLINFTVRIPTAPYLHPYLGAFPKYLRPTPTSRSLP